MTVAKAAPLSADTIKNVLDLCASVVTSPSWSGEARRHAVRAEPAGDTLSDGNTTADGSQGPAFTDRLSALILISNQKSAQSVPTNQTLAFCCVEFTQKATFCPFNLRLGEILSFHHQQSPFQIVQTKQAWGGGSSSSSSSSLLHAV